MILLYILCAGEIRWSCWIWWCGRAEIILRAQFLIMEERVWAKAEMEKLAMNRKRTLSSVTRERLQIENKIIYGDLKINKYKLNTLNFPNFFFMCFLTQSLEQTKCPRQRGGKMDNLQIPFPITKFQHNHLNYLSALTLQWEWDILEGSRWSPSVQSLPQEGIFPKDHGCFLYLLCSVL